LASARMRQDNRLKMQIDSGKIARKGEAETQETSGREDFVEMCAGAVRGDAMGCSRIRDPGLAQSPGA
jgi:hypothetical protein